jgi:hypothetical protein
MNPLTIRQKIKSGHIRVFGDLFKYITVSEMGRILERSDTHIKTIRANPIKMSMGDYFKLVDYISDGQAKSDKVDYREKVYELVGGDVIDK